MVFILTIKFFLLWHQLDLASLFSWATLYIRRLYAICNDFCKTFHFQAPQCHFKTWILCTEWFAHGTHAYSVYFRIL